ncbi:cell division protein FtsX [Mesorhizobium sp. Root157]|uniref:cell division protein FtsX n=1 Tax=Mesorhizobium sp. Root157 TaxID=1736477 RepID=UPI0006F7B987|nr:ABC transporter permease [Mesorhizobium sp. Root157]KRA00332.1 cell division protein FtsX [Mesorhizobium sp. Root157]
MTDQFDDRHDDGADGLQQAEPRQRAPRRTAPIVPAQNVVGRALVVVIAIMTFLSCVTFGAVTLVRDTASVWENQISTEATIQIKPADGLDMEAALATAAGIAGEFPGVKATRIIDRTATARLLEPWLGSALDIDQLPVPRLIVVTIDQANPPDFDAIRAAFSPKLPTASLDDHRTWVDRLVAMARTTVTIGIAVLALMLSATVMTVVFATRGAMAGNGHIIEVLHFVGAEARFIARQFHKQFLLTGMKGAAIGGVGAVVVFIVFSWWSSRNVATPQGDQAAALFGNFAIGSAGYLGVILMVIVIGALTAATSHATVIAYLNEIDDRQTDIA